MCIMEKKKNNTKNKTKVVVRKKKKDTVVASEETSLLEQAILLLSQGQKQISEAIEKQATILLEIKEWMKKWNNQTQEDEMVFSAKRINEISYIKTYRVMEKIYDQEYNITSYDLPLWITFTTEQEAHEYWIANFWQWNYWIITETKPQSVV